MNLKTYKFDAISMSQSTDKKLLSEARARGFYQTSTPYNLLFSNLFYKGGKLEFKKDLDPEFKARALPYLKSFMGSWEPRHEEKEAISALLLSELAQEPTE